MLPTIFTALALVLSTFVHLMMAPSRLVDGDKFLLQETTLPLLVRGIT